MKQTIRKLIARNKRASRLALLFGDDYQGSTKRKRGTIKNISTKD